jgi:hypothetical protein
MEKSKYSDWRKFPPHLFGSWEGGERVIYRRETLEREWELIGPMMIRVFVVYYNATPSTALCAISS